VFAFKHIVVSYSSHRGGSTVKPTITIETPGVNQPPLFRYTPTDIFLVTNGEDIRNRIIASTYTKLDYYQAYDPEGLKVSMSFSGHNDMPCRCMTLTQNAATFQVDVDLTRLTERDSGSWPVTVTLSDGKMTKDYEFNF